jgi:YHS domain-containing protein
MKFLSQIHFKSSCLSAGACLLLCFALCPQSAVSQDKEAPPWGEFLRQGRWPGFDRLLRRPFRMAPETDVKGLAAKLRARELDIPNRQRALKYLSKFHCSTFPEARAMLVKVMLEDEWEPVRLEAAEQLQAMFEECACQCGAEQDEPSGREKREALKFGSPDLDSARHCLCCCDAETLTALAKVAYETKEDGCCFEPSRRVRQAAVEAIKVCGIPCNCKPYNVGDEHAPPAYDEIEEPGTPKAIEDNGENVLPESGEENSTLLSVPTVTKAKPISRLKDICLVSLKTGTSTSAKPEFSSTYRGRVYHFSSRTAQQKFDAAPQRYAVAFGGCDPVHFVHHREVLEGRYLIQHDDRFYMFATKENYKTFQADIVRYTGEKADTSALALASQ